MSLMTAQKLAKYKPNVQKPIIKNIIIDRDREVETKRENKKMIGSLMTQKKLDEYKANMQNGNQGIMIKRIAQNKNMMTQSIIISENQKKFNKYLKDNKINQICISRSLSHFDRIKQIYDLKNYSLNSDQPTLFFGIYNMNEFENIAKYRGKKYIMFGGSDADDRIETHKQMLKQYNGLKNCEVIAISEDIQNRLNKYQINSTLIKLDLMIYELFKPRDKRGNKIYIYDGQGSITNSKQIVYGKKYIDEIVKRLPEYEYIFSSKLNQIAYEKMGDIYAQCFIGLRLTECDGNANTVQEFEAMHIPIVHNQSEYGLKWKNVDDIVKYIKYVCDIDLNRLNEYPIDMYQLTSLNEEILDNVNKNINNFNKIISKFKNILFIVGDYPGYGGAATNCNNLAKYYQKMGHNTFEFYYNFEKGVNAKYEKTNNYIIGDLNEIDRITFKPDLIILKSMVNFDLKKRFNSPIYYLIGGIYTNNLDKYYYNIETKEEQKKYINKSVIKQIKNSDYVFVNSCHTQEILKKYYNFKTYLFYSSFVPFIDRNLNVDENFNDRKYDYGLIISNFDRKIKNAEESIEFLKDKDNVILIGKNSDKYKKYGFTCVDLVNKDDMENYYKQIKYIVQDSFYESCSNVKIEGLMNKVLYFKRYFNSFNEIVNNLCKEKKDNNIYDFILYKNIKYNKSYLSKINLNIKNDFIIINEDYYLNNKINKIPIFITNNIIKKYYKNIFYVYDELFKNKYELEKYINYLIYELDNVEKINDRSLIDYQNLLKVINYLYKFSMGIVMISFGEGYNNIIINTINSYKNYTKLPILIYTDDPNLVNYFSNDKQIFILCITNNFINHINLSRIIKTQCYKYSPFKYTMYVDVDSLCCDNFEFVFDYLKNCDICMQPNVLNKKFKDINKLIDNTCVDRYIQINNKYKIFNNEDIFSIYAGGLVFFKKNNITQKIFNLLSKYWYESGGTFDMPSWMIALYKLKSYYKIYNLDKEYFNTPNSKIIKSLHYIPNNFIYKSKIESFIKNKYHPLTKKFELCDYNNKYLKKSIAILYDVDGWVLHQIANILKKYLSKFYIIEIFNESQGSILKNECADVFFTFNLMDYSIPHIDKSKIICGKTSHLRIPTKKEYDMFKITHANNKDIVCILEKISQKVFYIPNGIDLSIFYKYKNINTYKNKIKIGMICSKQRVEHKGLNEFLDVINRLKKHNIFVENNTIIIDPYKKDTIISNDSLIKYYNNDIDIYICLSNSETGPQPCLEALACGKIVISTRVGLMVDIINNDYNGYLVNDRSNTDDIVNIILNYMNKNDNTKEIMSQNCISSIQSYSWETQVINYKNMFDYYFKNYDLI